MISSAQWLILATNLSSLLIKILKKKFHWSFLWNSKSYYSHTKELLNGREVAANHTKVVGIINRNKAGYGISATYIAPV